MTLHDALSSNIYHLSTPVDFSINVDDTHTFINQLGPGILFHKIDLKDAFRLIPPNRLELTRNTQSYINICLSVGLRSAPFLSNLLADAMHWMINYSISHLLYYLDDFLTTGSTNSDICAKNLHNNEHANILQ